MEGWILLFRMAVCFLPLFFASWAGVWLLDNCFSEMLGLFLALVVVGIGGYFVAILASKFLIWDEL